MVLQLIHSVPSYLPPPPQALPHDPAYRFSVAPGRRLTINQI